MTSDYLKLTAYFSERQRVGAHFLADSMFDLLAENKIASSILMRGIASFGHNGIVRSDRSLTLSEDPPVAIAAIDSEQVISRLAHDAIGLMAHGTVTLERAKLVSNSSEVPLPDRHDVKLTVYVGRRKIVNGMPAYYAVCDVLHKHRFDGVSVLLGVDGTVEGERRRAKFFSRNLDVPLMIIAVGSAAKVHDAIDELKALIHSRTITIEQVQICIRDGELISRPTSLPTHDANGRPMWQKLMIHTSEAEHHDGVPIHRALVRRLWESHAASGATVLRGIWGYYGDHEPHGDAIIQFRRQVPVTTTVIDTPERMQHIFDIVDEVTGRRGLVSAEMVPALITVGDENRPAATELASYQY